MIKTRFAPSPTGYMHLGNLRTALFNALLANGKQGHFLLRIEDTDQIRSGEEFTVALQEDLHWLGLAWQEGPEVGGEHGPYWQSLRQEVYATYYARLEELGLVYPCFCTDQQLAIQRKVQLSSGQPPRYAGTCRHLSAEQIEQKRLHGIPATLRFHVKPDTIIEFNDLVRGQQRFNTNDIGDFIIRRADGTASFIFCNAIDDALMQVTHALRGEDHLTNTPRQLLILQALQLTAPIYGHISLIVGADGAPLSKRHGSRSIRELRAEGILPAGILNYLARLGHYYEQTDYLTTEQLAQYFTTEHLGSAPARFDETQLLYWQKLAVAHASQAELWDWIRSNKQGAEISQLVPEQAKALFLETIQPNITFPYEAVEWAKIFFHPHLIYSTNDKESLQQAGNTFGHEAIAAVEKFGLDFSAVSQALQSSLNVKGKALYQPLRIALTGKNHGPELGKIMQLLGREKVLQRLQVAFSLA